MVGCCFEPSGHDSQLDVDCAIGSGSGAADLAKQSEEPPNNACPLSRRIRAADAVRYTSIGRTSLVVRGILEYVGQ